MQTFSCHQSVRPAAAEAVQQGLGSDVVVEKRSRAADLHQTQPQPQEHRFVPEEHRDRVALLDASALQQHSGGLVAELIRFLEGVGLISKKDERLVRLRLHHICKAVQD